MRTEAKACFARNAPARVGNILSTVNIGQTRTTTQSYSYDDRYQLTGAEGLATATLGSVELWRNSYQQSYRYDRIGNMTGKTSSNQISPSAVQPGHLNYDLAYTYDADRPHQATRIGELAYRYDANGNLTHVFIPTAEDPNGEAIDPPTVTLNGNRGSAPEALGRFSWDTTEEPEYVARYQWNEENRMVQSITGDDVVTTYRYDASGIRSAKYSDLYGETIYADRMYQEHFGPNPPSLITKHIFVGQSRIASKLHYTDQTGATRSLFMQQNTYWYHADHLGSTNWVTDYQGEGYEHFAYTPYGESWVSENLDNDLFSMTHRFTGQELDPETGLYAFPMRNYDPRTSRWMSSDPAGPTLMVPGREGFSIIESTNWYSYVGNNPVNYHDPVGTNRNPSSVGRFFSSFGRHIRNRGLNTAEAVDFTIDVFRPSLADATSEQAFTAGAIISLGFAVAGSKPLRANIADVTAQISNQLGVDVADFVTSMARAYSPEMAGKGAGMASGVAVNRALFSVDGVLGAAGVLWSANAALGSLLRMSENLNSAGITGSDIDDLRNLLNTTLFEYTEGSSMFLAEGNGSIVSQRELLSEGGIRQRWFDVDGNVIDEAILPEH